jgi:transcriptional regulator with XRE-family HTH domain
MFLPSEFRRVWLVVDQIRRNLGRRVRELRTELGLSQEQVAERADLHWTHISGIERGQYDLKLSTLTRVARGLGITLSGLFAGIDSARLKTSSRR